MSAPVLTGIRPSLWARCVTAAVFQGRGELESEHPPEAQEYFYRGHVFEEIVMRQIEAKHGKENVQRQVVIPIPGIGEGHADGYLKPDKALIEVKSTVSAYPNSDTFTYGVEQLKRYIAYHPEAEKGYLYMIDPGRMKPADVYTVVLSDEDREKIERERHHIDVLAHQFTDPVADSHGSANRPCTRPSQARGRFCPFAAVCFPDWQPDPTEEITSPDALDAVSRLYAIKEEKRVHSAAIKALEEGEKAAQAELADYVEPGEVVVGGFSVKRTHVVIGAKFSERAAKAAGFPIETLAEFYAGGSEHDRWTIARAAERGTTDFGEDAPF